MAYCYVCKQCRKIYNAKNNDAKIKCPNCKNIILTNLNKSYEQWQSYDKEKRNEIIQNLINNGENVKNDESKQKNTSYYITGDPLDDSPYVYTCFKCNKNYRIREKNLVILCDNCLSTLKCPKYTEAAMKNGVDRAALEKRDNLKKSIYDVLKEKGEQNAAELIMQFPELEGIDNSIIKALIDEINYDCKVRGVIGWYGEGIKEIVKNGETYYDVIREGDLPLRIKQKVQTYSEYAHIDIREERKKEREKNEEIVRQMKLIYKTLKGEGKLSISQIIKYPEFEGISAQRVRALLTRMQTEKLYINKVKRYKIYDRTFFEVN